jgi:PKD repeat protein
MKKVLLFALISVILVVSVSGQSEMLDEMLNKNGEVYFRFEVSNHKDISSVTNIISIDNVKDNTVHAYANAKEIEAFKETGIPYKLLPHPNEGFQPLMKGIKELGSKTVWNFYPTYDAYVSLMYQFETNYPAICDVYSIGQTVQGRELLVAKISDNVGTDEAEPEFLYTSSMHGDEITGYVSMLHLMDSLLSNYGSVARITNLVNNIEIFINPLANPDGTYHGGNNSVSGAIRYNANSVDLNRNYPDPQNGPHPDGNSWQPETVAFMNFAESRHFVMSANFHGGAEVCNYPWDTKAALPADVNWWLFVCNEFADTVQAHSPSTYFTDLYPSGVTNGYAWYEVNGGRQDYMNYYHQCREQTIEISDIKLPAASTLLNYWGYLRRSLLNYLQQCTYSLRGMVTDANTGLPVEAEVFVVGHEADSSWVYSSPAGNYHRLLNAGTYNIQVSAPCYQTQTFYNVSVVNYSATNLNVQLIPNSNAVDFTASSTVITIGGTVTFTDQSCGNPYSWLWSITGPGTPVYVGGTSATSQNPIVQFNTAGSYTVALTATGAGGTFTQTKTNYITVTSCTVCTSGSNNGTEEWISNVTFNTINNSSAVGSGYTNYTAISTTVTKGSAYTLSATCGSTGIWTEHIWAFIDMNQDCDFTDANESYDLGQVSGPGTKTLSITIPSGATTGSTRLRVSLKYNSDPASCETFSYGEVEDYTLVIQAAGLPPVADFGADNTSPVVNTSVYFMDFSTNNPTSWSWSFTPPSVVYVEGTSSTSQEPVVQFTAGGSYTVSLTATNGSGSDTETKSDYIYVTAIPVAGFTVDNNSPVAGEAVLFTDLSTNFPVTWSWSFIPATVTYLGGTSSVSQNPQVQFDIPGIYSVQLYAANAAGSDIELKADYMDVQSLDFNVDLHIMLEGPFNGSDMNTDLNSLPDFPMSQPYSGSPWNYPGTESVTTVPPDVVDWILIDLRDATDASTATIGTRIAIQAAFVMSGGSLRTMDGVSLPQFSNLTIQQSLFVVVWHRNHLPVLSANSLIKAGNTYSYDFSSAMAQVYGTDAQKFLSAGIYGMIGGDANADGLIDNPDKDYSWQTETGTSGYLPSDLNLDGQSGNSDKNDIWLPELGKASQLP